MTISEIPIYLNLGGTINNVVIVQRGYVNANNDTLRGAW